MIILEILVKKILKHPDVHILGLVKQIMAQLFNTPLWHLDF